MKRKQNSKFLKTFFKTNFDSFKAAFNFYLKNKYVYYLHLFKLLICCDSIRQMICEKNSRF